MPGADTGPAAAQTAAQSAGGQSATAQSPTAPDAAAHSAAARTAAPAPQPPAPANPPEEVLAAIISPAGELRPDGLRGPGGRPAVDVRTLTRVLFERLAELPPDAPERERVRAALIEVNIPLVRYAATRFRSRSEPMEDVVQVGTIGLINAIDRFDPSRGVQFPTYALPTILGEIKRYFRDNVRTMHVPRRLQELWVQVSGAMEELTVVHGRAPKVPEIAASLRIPEEDVRACLDAGRAYNAASLEAAQEHEGGLALLDRLGYEDSALAEVEHRDMVRHLLVQLPERERRIVMLRFFANLTQSQISTELGMSQMHVSRLLSRILTRLRTGNSWED
ncbi:RNA polymerase sigma factor SigF [Kitasatospora sp. CM 4170]|uniref:RNA polymerase sigma factor SigF n=1 Tax=Kitasatospora aburaviensis TaxID=67265 RepID=A0ABW1F645_9ACTN|nr:RNA polymerase sigma factor SigF [Kitasatospora sp. CM 4170]WNM46691.1 RNA polymerase sigma factor SigF [Kitasatospora sp. CM 4170]